MRQFSGVRISSTFSVLRPLYFDLSTSNSLFRLAWWVEKVEDMKMVDVQRRSNWCVPYLFRTILVSKHVLHCAKCITIKECQNKMSPCMLERFKYYLSCGHPHNTTDLEFCRGQAVGPICEGQDLQYGKVSITSRYAPVQCTDEAFQKIKKPKRGMGSRCKRKMLVRQSK